MAKLCMKARERVRIKMSGNARTKREALKKVVSSPVASYEEKVAAGVKLNKSPRDESPIRVRNRCRICGRSRGVYRKIGLCRIHFREAMMRGDVPGCRKASW
jgi:small subunit ribosomal protein S14